jgi:hypothetical protein
MRPLLLIVLSVLSGCDGEPAVQTCDEMAAGLSRDSCYHDELRAIPGSGIEEVLVKASLIQDQMIRQAAVSAWMKAHLNEIPRDRGQALCQMLDGQDQSYCMRQLSSPHLYEDRSPVAPNSPSNPPPPEN